MAFGKAMGSMKALKKSLERGGAGGQWIKYVPKNSSMNVRFASEPEGWVNYDEHYDQMARKSYPCNGESSCQGCQNNDRKTSRYLANAIDLDANNGAGRLIALQLPKDLANRLVVKYEKWGTIMDRDIELTRSGEGLDTLYDLDPSSPSRKNMNKFLPLHDLEKVLQDAWDNVWGDMDDDEDDEDEKPRTKKAAAAKAGVAKARARSKARAVLDEDDDVDEDDDEDEDDEPVKPAARRAAAKRRAKAPEPEFEEDDEDEDEEVEDEEPDEDDEDDEESEVEYTIEELMDMPLGQLRRIARDEFGVDPTGKNKKAIIKAIEAENPPY